MLLSVLFCFMFFVESYFFHIYSVNDIYVCFGQRCSYSNGMSSGSECQCFT